MAGPTSGHDNLTISSGYTSKTPPWKIHVLEPLPADRVDISQRGEIKPEDTMGRGGVAKGVGAGVKQGPANQVKERREVYGTETGEVVEERGAGEVREGAPGEGEGIEEERRNEGRIGGEEAEERERWKKEGAAEREG